MTGHARLLRRWVRATWGGWLLGIPCIIALALAGEAVGIGGSQVLVGAGMGAGVGFLQGRVMRDLIGRSGPWAWSTAVGLALPLLAFDLARAAGRDWPFSLYPCVAIGGLLVGAWQARLLRPHFRRTGSWTAASAVGWFLAAGAAALADAGRVSQSIRGIAGALLFLAIVAFGGLVLGLVTGAALARLPRQGAAA
jgi:hypothetical protein